MLANSVLMNARHPLRYLPRSNKIYLARDGVTEIEGPGYSDKRMFIMTLLDPFDIVGMIRRKDQQTRFWETEGSAGPGGEPGGESGGNAPVALTSPKPDPQETITPAGGAVWQRTCSNSYEGVYNSRM